MSTESLTTALPDRERDLRGEGSAAAHARTLERAADALFGSARLDEGIATVLRLSADATRADACLLLRAAADDRLETAIASDPWLAALSWPGAARPLRRTRLVHDLAEVAWRDGLPPPVTAFRSLLAVPVPCHAPDLCVVVLLARELRHFSRLDQKMLLRIGRLLTLAVDRQNLVERNRHLSRIVGEATDDPPASAVADNSVSLLGRAYAHVTDWQGQIVAITNDLLSADRDGVDDAVDRALARIGSLSRSDRTYVFRLRGDDRMDNTHEWVAPGIEPMIDALQDMSTDLLDDYRATFEGGSPVVVPDVEALPEDTAIGAVLRMQGIRSLLLVPMLRHGRIAGFMGYDAVRTLRRFLPVEVELLRSVANALSVVFDRFDAETAARNAQIRLEEQRNRLQATLSAIPDLVLELDEDGRIIGYNEGTPLSPAYPPETFLGRFPEQVLPLKLSAIARRLMQDAARDGESGAIEYQLEIAGKARWFVANAAAKRTGGGYVIVVGEITQRRNEQRQIRRLGKIAELTSNMVIITDPQGRIDWVNPAFERRSGWRLDEVRGKTPGRILRSPNTDRATVRRIAQALAKRRPVQGELLNRDRFGEDYWISKDIQPLFDENGQLDGFVSVQTDITELKRSHEKALNDLAQALDASNDGIAITDAKGRFVYMNRSHRTMFGIAHDAALDQIRWQDLYAPEAAAIIAGQAFAELARAGVWRGEIEGRHADGDPVPQEVSLTLKPDGGILCITRDTAERLRIEADRARLREELQLAQRRETVAQVAGAVAHDLNNLVAVVSGTAELLADGAQDNPDLLAGLERIQRATGTARSLVDGLRHLDRPSAPRALCDLNIMIAEAIELLGTQRIRDHGITAPPRGPARNVWVNRGELLQVLLNLALNACDAGPPETNRVGLSILPASAVPPDRRPDVGTPDPGAAVTLFAISDTGAGIAPSMRGRLFERYFTTKGEAGTGLGLPIVASIIRQNGAALWLDSEPGRGTTVTVAWPSVSPDRPLAERRAPRLDLQGDLGGHWVLVVDDMPDVADVLAKMIETAGAEVIAVSDPAEALALLRETPTHWSALVTDLDMPGMTGIDLAQAAAALPVRVPVLLVTALPEVVGSAEALFSDVLHKPVEAARLIAALRVAVAKRAVPADG